MPAPSVLLLIADDWSPIARCYGDTIVQTPHIDALAKQSTVFNQAFCTTPSCAASRASILTGLYSHQHGQYGHSHGIHGFTTHAALANHTLPAVLKQQNIFTGLIGKSHVAPALIYPFDVQDFADPHTLQGPADSVRSFLNAASDKPFYLQVATTYPHRNIGAGFHRGDQTDEFFSDDILYESGNVPVPAWLPDLPEVRQDIADYYTFISRFDRFVGSILKELTTANRDKDTLVILMSDHGMPFPGAKASMFDSGHHCPLIIRSPKHAAATSNALTNWQDIYPTICDYLQVPQSSVPDFLPGQSLMPVITSPDTASNPEWDHTYFSHNFHEVTNYYPYRVLRERQYKYTMHLAYELPLPLPSDLFSSPTWQAVRNEGMTQMGVRNVKNMMHQQAHALYDIQKDPHETTNLIDDPALAEVAARMRESLQAFRIKTCDPWLELDYQAGLIPDRPAASVIPM